MEMAAHLLAILSLTLIALEEMNLDQISVKNNLKHELFP